MGLTSIEYSDWVSNPLQAFNLETGKRGTFCEKPDPDGTCRACWAESLNKRFGNGLAFDRSNREKIEWRKNEKEMRRLERLNATKPESEKFPGHRLIVFTNDTYDLFQPSITDEQRDWVFDHYDHLTNLQLLVQTTYVSRMATYLNARYPKGMPYHYFIGMSAGNQKWLEDKYRLFVSIKALWKYIIFEPLLGPINLSLEIGAYEPGNDSPLRKDLLDFIDLIIVGGESGTQARPCDIQWIRSIVRQTQHRRTKVLVKQLGAKPVKSFTHIGDLRPPAPFKLKSAKGKDMAEWPEDLRVREMPEYPF